MFLACHGPSEVNMVAAAMSTLSSERRSQCLELLERGRTLNALANLASPQPLHEGPLSGLTFVAKDMFSWPDHAYSRGLQSSVAFDGKPAVFLNQLVGEGAELVGFSEMTPLAYEPSGANPYRGRPVNPIDPNYVCGGSSSGSAVLVAAGLVDFAVGSDTAGSLRIPAQCCGVAAWKPSFGLFCRAGSWPLAPSLDTLGILARDTDMLLRVGRAVLPSSDDHPLRIAVANDVNWPNHHDPDRVRAACGDWSAPSIPLQNVMAMCDDVVLTLLQKEAYDSNRTLLEDGLLDPVLTKRLLHGGTISEDRYQAACAGLAVLRAELAETLFEHTDIIVLPVMPCTTPRVAECEPGSAEFSARKLYEMSHYTRFVNALGLPAVAIPLPAPKGTMPNGVQLIARHGSGLAVLRAAHHLESHLHALHLKGMSA